MSDHSELIAKFTGVTGCDPDRAQFYLESSLWNLDVALASFFDEDDNGDAASGAGNQGDPSNVGAPPTSPPEGEKQSAPKPTSGSRFGRLNVMRDQEESDSDEEGQAFYVGGSERGAGQQVLGPPREKNAKKYPKLVQEMFEAAKEHGAETVEPGTSQRKTGNVGFRGTAYRLGDTEGESEKVSGAPLQEPQQVDMVLKLWQNGFTVDEGPLREYNDPANQEFLSAIKKGEVPRELLRLAKGGEVNLNMEDHRQEDFVPPKQKVKAFAGEGYRLGSPAGNIAAAPAASGASSQASCHTSQRPPAAVKVDESSPTTNIQIRLSDGTRLVSKFNHTHTVADVRAYIMSSHPASASANFVLMTTFPNKELTDESASLKDANLLNAVLVQRMK